MRVGRLREPEGTDYVEVMFLESARIYRVAKENPGFEKILTLLRDAGSNRRILRIRFASPQSDFIEDVQEVESS
ncbi:hypothetical protein L0222_05915 [bacterium]|nr:hypothetical protein [bacterium]